MLFSFSPLSDMLKFSGQSRSSEVVTIYFGILVSSFDINDLNKTYIPNIDDNLKST